MEINDIWNEMKRLRYEQGCEFWKLRWYLRATLALTAISTLLLITFFAGLFG